MDHCVIILFSIHYVLKAEKLLKEHGLAHDVVPVPREISSDCGMAIEFDGSHYQAIAGILKNSDINIARMYRKIGPRQFVEIAAYN